MKFLRFLTSLLIIILCHFNQLFAQVYIEPGVQRELKEKGFSSCVLAFQPLILKDKIPANRSKTEKGNTAYNLLKNHLKDNILESCTILDKSKIKYRINYLSSTINAYHCPEAIVIKLAGLTNVKAVLYNYSFDGIKGDFQENSGGNRDSYTWGIIKTEANVIQELGYRGQGAVVGGNDTGFDWTHPAITTRYRGYNNGGVDHNYNWHDAIHEVSPLSNPNQNNPCGLSLTAPCDDHSHGTHTVGTMVGVKEDNEVIGMAPDAKWIGTRNMERGNGSLQSYLEALDWFLAPTDTNDLNPDPAKSPHVINNSWYCSEEEGCNVDNWNLMQVSIANLKAAGIVVVASAGNSGPRCESIAFVPGMLDEVFSVGATNQVDTIAGFSSRGLVTADGSNRLKPDIAAPGVGVLSSVLNHQYSYSSGTSMAGPHVAGLVALMVGANPDLAGQVDTIQEIIKRTADPLTLDQTCNGLSGLDIPNPIYGHGRINAFKAVTAAINHGTNKTVSNKYHSLQLYPNPANDQLVIGGWLNDGVVHVEICEMNGKPVFSSILNQRYSTLNLEPVPPGTYLVRAIADRSVYIGKFVKI